MDPQLTDYYNEMPHGVNVIEKMNEEYAELEEKVKQLEKEMK